MNTVQERSSSRQQPESFVIAKSENGYRVCSTLAPSKQYVVTGVPNNPECTCPNFMHPERPPDWQCEHILAVLNDVQNKAHASDDGTPTPTPTRSIADLPPTTGRKRGPNGHSGKGAMMLLKRSVSPDGRIDSLSVEFSCPLGTMTNDEIKEQADGMLSLQTAIASSFLGMNGRNGNGNGQTIHRNNGSVPPDAVSARLLGVGSMQTRRGQSLFLNVLVNGKMLKLFGDQKQLAEAVAAAGFPETANQAVEGTQFDLPCRVVTKPNGKYVNVERVYPAESQPAPRA